MRRRTKKQPRRKAIVLIAVLVVVVVLSLAAYQFSELMMAEQKASDSFRKSAQVRAGADSGIHYAMALLSNSDAFTNTLNSNPYDNAAAFQAQFAQQADPGKAQVRFSIVAPLSQGETQTTSGMLFRYGVIDESGKINLNSLLKWDSTGQKGHDLLMKLPNMTDDIADSILDWLDPDDEARPNGAESNYYQTLNPPYNAKNGPLDTLDELLLVKGVTPQLLYGNDRNRNGVIDEDEIDDGLGNPLGWSAFLTVFTHETNVDASGNARIYLNDSDLNSLADKLNAALGEDLANYIIAYRLYGPSSSQGGGTGATGGAAGGASAGAGAGAAQPAAAAPATPLSAGDRSAVTSQLTQARSNSSQQQQLHKINSLFDLVNSSVAVPSNSAGGAGGAAGGGGAGGGTTRTTQIAITSDGRQITAVTTTTQTRSITYPSPLNDRGQLATLLPLLLDATTTTKDTDLPGKVNVNTAPQAVLATLPGLTEQDVQSILAQRPDPSSTEAPDSTFQTLAWLITTAELDANKVKALETYITARTQVYRVQSIGYFDGDGPTVRIEAVIDTNNGRPRILMRRDLTDMGKGFDIQSGQ